MKPIEFSDDAWKIVETETFSALTAVNVRAAMPGTPAMPLPATVTTAWPRTVARAFTGCPFPLRRAVTSVPGCVGSRNDRTRNVMRVPAIGISARGCSTFAP